MTPLVAAYPALVAYARHIAGDWHLGEDIAHDAIERVLRHGYPEAEQVAVTRRAILNRHRDLMRRQRSLRWVPIPDLWLGAVVDEQQMPVPDALLDYDSPETTVLRAEVVTLVRSVLAGLPEVDRLALTTETSERLTLRDKSRRFRAKRRFRAEWRRVA